MTIYHRTLLACLFPAALLLVVTSAGAGHPDVASAEAPAPLNASPVLSWTPERPTQGHLFVIRVTPSPGEAIVSVGGTAAGEALHFEMLGDGSFESLAATPVDAEGRVPVTVVVSYRGGREETLEPTVPVTPGSFAHERLTVAPRFGGPLNPEDQARLDSDRVKAAQVSREAHSTPRLWGPELVMPRSSRVTSGFGDGREFNGRISSRHMGLDLDGDPGDTVVAVVRGVVAAVEPFLLAGNVVYLNHGGGLLSGYFHLSEQLVAVGDTVEAGTPIGRVGATGRVTGPHLHWVVRYGSTSVDPRSLPGLRADGG